MSLFIGILDGSFQGTNKPTFSPLFLKTLQEPHLKLKIIKASLLQERLRLSEKNLMILNKDYHLDGFFFSASYTTKYLFLAISNQKVGVDLETVTPRSVILLQQYTTELEDFFGETNWFYFYMVWTAREAVLKASNTYDLGKMNDIKLLSLSKREKYFGTLLFSWELLFAYQNREWRVYTHPTINYCYSICFA